jgi:OmpA-OmpF porin, OOP family
MSVYNSAMKNFIILLITLFLVNAGRAQTSERRWNTGIHGGLSQYNGDLGWGLYRTDQAAYGHIGLSVSRYLTRRFDASLYLTTGELGHLERNVPPGYSLRTHFLISLNTANLMLRYNFRDPKTIIRPFLFVGGGVIHQNGIGPEYPSRRFLDFSLPTAGGGINFRVNPVVNIQITETFMYTNADDLDLTIIGANDLYLFHSIGLTLNLGKRKNGNEGVGKRIDICPEDYSTSENGKESSNGKKKNKIKSKPRKVKG